MKSIIAECRIDKSLFETSKITEEMIKRDLASKIIHKMSIKQLEQLFKFVEKDMNEDPEYMYLHPGSDLVHFAAKIYLSD